MRVLVTGGTGFFGRGFVKHLIDKKIGEVCVFSRGEYQQSLMREEFAGEKNIRFFIGDVRDRDRLTRAMHGVELVVHAAALKRVEVGEYDSSEMVKTNVMGAMNVIEAATDAGVSKVVALSSDKACEPCNCYGATKLVSEKLFLAANNARGKDGPIYAVVRYGNVAGSTGSVIPTWRRAIEQDRLAVLTHPDATRFWMTLYQAVDLVWRTAVFMKGGELEIPRLAAYRLQDLAEAMFVRYSVEGLSPGEKMHESMRVGETSADARRMSVPELRAELKHV